MIILHKEKENEYKSNGLGLLDRNIIDPEVRWKLNGEYTFKFTYPLHAPLGFNIKERQQVELVTDGFSDVFRIKKTKKEMGMLEVFCEQKSYDLLDNFIEDINIVRQPGTEAVKRIQNGLLYKTPFTITSNITRVANARMVRLSGIQALIDDTRANSFVSRWGGEIYRNYNIIKVNNRIGMDKGVVIRHRKDLLAYDAHTDYTSVATRIRPVGFDGLTLPELYIDSPLMDPEYPIVREVKFENIKAAVGDYADDKDALPLEEAIILLREEAKKLFSDKQIDRPKMTYKIDFVNLANTEEYKDFIDLQTIDGGDTVRVEHKEDDFSIKARCVEFNLNPLTGSYTSMTLGEFTESFTASVPTKRDLDDIVIEQNEKSETYARKLSREIAQSWLNQDAYNYELESDNPYGLPAGYYTLNDRIDGNPTEIIGLSGGRLVISNRKNEDGTFEFTTFGTGNGFVADLIVAGALRADLIKVGLLSDVLGNFTIDMENGNINIGDKFIYNSKSGELTILGYADDADLQGAKTEFKQTSEQILQRVRGAEDDISDLKVKDGQIIASVNSKVDDKDYNASVIVGKINNGYGVSISGDKVNLQGRHITLDGNTEVMGSFKVGDANIRNLSAETITTGTLKVNSSGTHTGTLNNKSATLGGTYYNAKVSGSSTGFNANSNAFTFNYGTNSFEVQGRIGANPRGNRHAIELNGLTLHSDSGSFKSTSRGYELRSNGELNLKAYTVKINGKEIYDNGNGGWASR